MIKNDQTKFYDYTFTVLLCLAPFIAILAPRGLAFLPSIIALFSLALYKRKYGLWPIFSSKILGWSAAIIALATFSALWSISPEVSMERSLKTGFLFLGSALLLCLSTQPSEKIAQLFTKLFPLAVLAGTSVCVLELYTEGPIYKILHPAITEQLNETQRLNMSSFNRCAAFLMLCFWAAFSLLKHSTTKPKLQKFITAALIITTLAIIIKTESQSAQIALLTGGIFYFFFPVHRPKVWYILIGLCLALIWGAPWFMPYLFDYLPARIINISWFQSSYASERLEIWDFISRRIQENPLYGFGIEATRATENFETDKIFFIGQTVLHPHNFALQIWIEFGAIGIALLSGFLTSILLWIKNLPAQSSRLCLATLFAALSIASTGYGLWQGWWIGALFIAASLCLIVHAILSKNQTQEKP